MCQTKRRSASKLRRLFGSNQHGHVCRWQMRAGSSAVLAGRHSVSKFGHRQCVRAAANRTLREEWRRDCPAVRRQSTGAPSGHVRQEYAGQSVERHDTHDIEVLFQHVRRC